MSPDVGTRTGPVGRRGDPERCSPSTIIRQQRTREAHNVASAIIDVLVDTINGAPAESSDRFTIPLQLCLNKFAVPRALQVPTALP